MPHVSKKEIDSKEIGTLLEEFIIMLQKSVKKNNLESVLWDFLTPTEKIMFAKRFAVITLLNKKKSVCAIAQTLGMSPATVDRMSLRYEIGKYNSLISVIKSQKFSEKMELFLLTAGGMVPPLVGRKRVKELKKGI